MNHAVITVLGFLLLAMPAAAEEGNWRHLFAEDLAAADWEGWLGKPHSSVDLSGFSQTVRDQVAAGKPIGPVGFDEDPLQTYTTFAEGEQIVVRISGEVFGTLSTKEVFRDYHLSIQFKWGEKKWPPRENKVRDSGLLLHSIGPQGVHGDWPTCLECQIQELDCGDFFQLGGAKAKIRTERKIRDGSRWPRFDVNSDHITIGHAEHSDSEEKPNGQWNTVEAYVLDNGMVFIVNGTPNMAVLNGSFKNEPMTEGRIQLQSEGAEIFYRDLKIRPISKFPEFLAKFVRPIKPAIANKYSEKSE